MPIVLISGFAAREEYITHNTSSKEENECKEIQDGHDEAWECFNEDGREANQRDEQTEGASEGIETSDGRDRTIRLPLCSSDGQGQHDDREEELEGSNNTGDDHVDRSEI